MRYVNILNSDDEIHIISENKIIEIHIEDMHPELFLEDNSILVLDSVETYYKMIGDTTIFPNGGIDRDINLNRLVELITESDSVINTIYKESIVNMIFKLSYNNHNNIYYIQRTGINNLA